MLRDGKPIASWSVDLGGRWAVDREHGVIALALPNENTVTLLSPLCNHYADFRFTSLSKSCIFQTTDSFYLFLGATIRFTG